jgi:Fur family ferric uptake transcriptional regulator
MPAPAPTIDDLLDVLRSRGERVTVARRAVLEQLVADPDAHLTADTITERVQRDQPDVHLSTVYRTLELLVALGILNEVRVGHGPSSYHFTANTHHHAVCERCGAEVELPADLFDPVVRHLSDAYGFAADPSHLTINGLCATCRRSP